MSIFAVIVDQPSPALDAKIKAKFDEPRRYKLNDRTWMVVSDQLSNPLADELEIRTGNYGRAVVIRVSNSTSGWQQKSFWEWMSAKGEG